MKRYNLTVLIIILSLIISCFNNKKSEIEIDEKNIAGKSEVNKVKVRNYGSRIVGFVDMPEDWYEFKDPDATQNAVQLALSPYDIITLDILSVDKQITAEQALESSYEGFMELGISKNDIMKNDVEINGYKGKQLVVKLSDGRELTINYIDYDGKVYYIALEGSPAEKSKLEAVVNTWNLDK